MNPLHNPLQISLFFLSHLFPFTPPLFSPPSSTFAFPDYTPHCPSSSLFSSHSCSFSLSRSLHLTLLPPPTPKQTATHLPFRLRPVLLPARDSGRERERERGREGRERERRCSSRALVGMGNQFVVYIEKTRRFDIAQRHGLVRLYIESLSVPSLPPPPVFPSLFSPTSPLPLLSMQLPLFPFVMSPIYLSLDSR